MRYIVGLILIDIRVSMLDQLVFLPINAKLYDSSLQRLPILKMPCSISIARGMTSVDGLNLLYLYIWSLVPDKALF